MTTNDPAPEDEDSTPPDASTNRRSDEPTDDREPPIDRWLPGHSVLDAELPDDVRAALERLIGGQTVETLGDWVAVVRQHADGDALSADDLCHAGEETGHRGEMGGETYHFRCFYDAVILAALADRPVDVRTENPGGAVVEARAVGTDELHVVPESAVFSFGVDETVGPPDDGGPSRGDVYAAVCPYVRAFVDAEAYERWAEDVPAATVAMPLPGATELAAAFVP